MVNDHWAAVPEPLSSGKAANATSSDAIERPKSDVTKHKPKHSFRRAHRFSLVHLSFIGWFHVHILRKQQRQLRQLLLRLQTPVLDPSVRYSGFLLQTMISPAARTASMPGGGAAEPLAFKTTSPLWHEAHSDSGGNDDRHGLENEENVNKNLEEVFQANLAHAKGGAKKGRQQKTPAPRKPRAPSHNATANEMRAHVFIQLMDLERLYAQKWEYQQSVYHPGNERWPQLESKLHLAWKCYTSDAEGKRVPALDKDDFWKLSDNETEKRAMVAAAVNADFKEKIDAGQPGYKMLTADSVRDMIHYLKKEFKKKWVCAIKGKGDTGQATTEADQQTQDALRNRLENGVWNRGLFAAMETFFPPSTEGLSSGPWQEACHFQRRGEHRCMMSHHSTAAWSMTTVM